MPKATQASFPTTLSGALPLPANLTTSPSRYPVRLQFSRTHSVIIRIHLLLSLRLYEYDTIKVVTRFLTPSAIIPAHSLYGRDSQRSHITFIRATTASASPPHEPAHQHRRQQSMPPSLSVRGKDGKAIELRNEPLSPWRWR